MGMRQQRIALLLMLGAATGACVSAPPPPLASAAAVAGADCRTASASLHFDFPGASAAACSVTGARDFTLLITPEHAPPINPSPWYGFRYQTDGTTDPVTVTLRYLGGRHRYAPKWSDGGGAWRELPSTPVDEGKGAAFELPPGKGVIAAQEIIAPADTMAAMQRWSAASGARPFTLGQSHDGRPIEAIRLGRADAPRLVILIGRQHPPEVTGAMAMEAFVDTLVDHEARKVQALADLQFLIVPMLNPDGVTRGHWRANRGAVDLNRDWGIFTQPETRAVKAWLDALPPTVRPVLMVDFHSTGRNLFYVQGDKEATAAQQRFVELWLGGQEKALAGYPFTIEPTNANPGSGTSKNWFHATYGIPAITYEVADTADRTATRSAAKALAHRLLTVLASAP
jgi:predicted deacylase